ncbi:MAG: hypothetical protein AAF663_11315 [Planctomycetota bacterium]
MQKFGNLTAAESAYRDALRSNPENPHARDLLHRVNGAARREFYRGERLQEVGETVWALWATPHCLGIVFAVGAAFLGYWNFIWKPFVIGEHVAMPPVTVFFFGFWLVPTFVVANVRTLMQITSQEQVDDPPRWRYTSVIPLASTLTGFAFLSWLLFEEDRSPCIFAATAAAMSLSLSIGLTFGKPWSPYSVMKPAWAIVGTLHSLATAFALSGYALGEAFPFSGTMAERLALYPAPFLPLLMAVAVVWDQAEA